MALIADRKVALRCVREPEAVPVQERKRGFAVKFHKGICSLVKGQA